jgi:uncharacterized protein (DUF1697 family)
MIMSGSHLSRHSCGRYRERVIYFSRLIRKASQSRLSRIVGLPIYKNMTIRNWNTATKLLALMEARTEGK